MNGPMNAGLPGQPLPGQLLKRTVITSGAGVFTPRISGALCRVTLVGGGGGGNGNGSANVGGSGGGGGATHITWLRLTGPTNYAVGAGGYMDKVEKAICRQSDMPRCVFDTDVAISNTAGIAIRLMYKPLLDKVGRKRVPMDEGISRVNDIIVRIIKVIDPATLNALVEKPDKLRVRPLFTDSLPENTNEILDAEIKKLSQNLTSRAESFRTINAAKDMTRIAGEIVMDMRAQLAMDREKAVALQGGTPNLTAPFLGSIPANEDFESVAEEANNDSADSQPDSQETPTTQQYEQAT